MVLAASSAQAATRTLYEWSAVAPVVVIATSLSNDGKYHQVRVERVFRGNVRAGDILSLNLRNANRDRQMELDRKALRPENDSRWIWLLEATGGRTSHDLPVYNLVRGVRGARELPAEGEQAFVEALEQFIEVQDLKTDSAMWPALRDMLEADAALLLYTSLDQHLKFHRGDPDLLLTLRPLMEHPQAEIREMTALLVKQILRRHGGESAPEVEALQNELVSLARRDPEISVRVAATEAIAELPAVHAILEAIAESDPEQNVRFAAEKLLLDLRQTRN
jgi:hypothetical protein